MIAKVIHCLWEERWFLEQIFQIKYTFFVLFESLINFGYDVNKDVKILHSLPVHMLHDHPYKILITIGLEIMMNKSEDNGQGELGLLGDFLFCKILDVLI